MPTPTVDQLLTAVTIVSEVLAALAIGLLFSFGAAVFVGMWLQQRANGYRLPYEQPTHVRLIREDPS